MELRHPPERKAVVVHVLVAICLSVRFVERDRLDARPQDRPENCKQTGQDETEFFEYTSIYKRHRNCFHLTQAMCYFFRTGRNLTREVDA